MADRYTIRTLLACAALVMCTACANQQKTASTSTEYMLGTQQMASLIEAPVAASMSKPNNTFLIMMR